MIYQMSKRQNDAEELNLFISSIWKFHNNKIYLINCYWTITSVDVFQINLSKDNWYIRIVWIYLTESK